MDESEFSSHQIDLLLGKVSPSSNEEWEFMQNNANAVIPKVHEEAKPTIPPMPPGIDELPPPGVNSGNLSKNKPAFVPPTFISKTAEVLEEKDK